MKKIVPAMLAAGVLLLAGCGGSAVSESTIEVTAKGTVIQTTIETLDSDYYDSDELKDFVNDQVDAYNDDEDAAGTIKVKKYKYSESDALVTLVLKFSDAQTYADFEQLTFFSGTVAEAKEAGYSFAVTFITPEAASLASGDASADASGDESESADASSGDASEKDGTSSLNLSGEEQVIILQESYQVKVPGDLLYVTMGSCGYVSEDTVEVDAPDAELVYIIYQ